MTLNTANTMGRSCCRSQPMTRPMASFAAEGRTRAKKTAASEALNQIALKISTWVTSEARVCCSARIAFSASR